MKTLLLLGLALPGAAVAQSSPPPGISWQDRPATAAAPLPTRPAEIRRTETLPPITPAPPEVEAMLAPEYVAPDYVDPAPVAANEEYRAVRPGDRVDGAWQHPHYALDPAVHALPEPPVGARWIRLIDGALLVEADGRVLDTRWGLAAPTASNPAQDHLGDHAGSYVEQAPVAPPAAYGVPTAPAMIVIQTTTMTSGPPR